MAESSPIPEQGHQRPTQKYLNRYVKQEIGKKWYDLGIELLENDDIGTLNNIQSNYSKDQEECCTKMFQLWLTKQSASWNQLIEALRQPNIKLNHLATSIEEMLLPSNPPKRPRLMVEPQQSTLISVHSLDADFTSLLLKVSRILNKSPDSHNNLKECKDYCSLLSISNNSDDKKSLFSAEKKLEIKECSDFTELFEIVGKHMSWDEHSILINIVSECKSDEGKQEIEKFEKKLALFQGLQIISVKSSKKASSKEFATFCVIINKPYKDVTLEDYKKIKAYIFSNLNVYAHVSVGFIRLLCHSLHIEWLVTVHAVPHMIQSAHQNKDFFIKEKFIYLQIGSKVVIGDKDTLAQHSLIEQKAKSVKSNEETSDVRIEQETCDDRIGTFEVEKQFIEVILMKLKQRFTTVLSNLIHIFKKKKVDIEELITILCFDDVDKNTIFSTDTAFNTITTENKLFHHVAQYCKSIYDYQILVILVEASGCEEAIEELRNFTEFLQHSVLSEIGLMSEHGELMNPDDFLPGTYKFVIHYVGKKCQIGTKEMVEGIVEQSVRLKKGTLIFKGIKRGIILFMYQISGVVKNYLLLYKFTIRDLAFLQENRIASLTVDGIIIMNLSQKTRWSSIIRLAHSGLDSITTAEILIRNQELWILRKGKPPQNQQVLQYIQEIKEDISACAIAVEQMKDHFSQYTQSEVKDYNELKRRIDVVNDHWGWLKRIVNKFENQYEGISKQIKEFENKYQSHLSWSSKMMEYVYELPKLSTELEHLMEHKKKLEDKMEEVRDKESEIDDTKSSLRLFEASLQLINEEYDEYQKKLAKCSSANIVEESEIETVVSSRPPNVLLADVVEVIMVDQTDAVKKQWQWIVEMLEQRLDWSNKLIKDLQTFEEQYSNDLAFIEQGEELINEYQPHESHSLTIRMSKHQELQMKITEEQKKFLIMLEQGRKLYKLDYIDEDNDIQERVDTIVDKWSELCENSRQWYDDLKEEQEDTNEQEKVKNELSKLIPWLKRLVIQLDKPIASTMEEIQVQHDCLKDCDNNIMQREPEISHLRSVQEKLQFDPDSNQMMEQFTDMWENFQTKVNTAFS